MLLCGLLLACGAAPTPPPRGPAQGGAQPPVLRQRAAVVPGENGASTAAPDSLPRLRGEEDWRALAARPQRELSAHTEVVKFIVDLEDNHRVYFLQTERWELHYYFIQRFLTRNGVPIAPPEQFWQREYLSQDRRFVQGTLIRYRDQGVYTLELIAQDVLDVPRTLEVFRRVRENVWFGGELRYHPVPAHHLAALATIRAQVPVSTTDELFAGTRYQPLTVGEAYGYLRIVRGALEPAQVRRNDVVVLAQTPLDLPACAGVITAELQTGLSHIAVLTANRGTPNMALRGAAQDPALVALEGRLVRLHVTPQEYTVTLASQADAERAWQSQRPSQAMHPPLDRRDTGLPLLTALSRSDVNTVGAKAAQLGELTHITPPLTLPRGFGVPFAAYLEHLSRNGIDRELRALLGNPAFQNDPQARASGLEAIRRRIEQAPVNPALVDRIAARIREQFPGVRVRLRSSTNVEDLEGFNGAGLYLSTSVPASSTREQLADGLRRVWASAWTFVGFEERSWFRIEQTEVAMGILVQESIDDDVAVGVAITSNPFDQGRPGFYINAQVSAGSVTGARSGEVAEQLLWYTYPAPGALERMGASSLTHGAPVLTDEEARGLSASLLRIQEHFYGPFQWQDGRAMDVEYLVAGPSRRLVVVQARPFTVRYTQGREYTWRGSQ